MVISSNTLHYDTDCILILERAQERQTIKTECCAYLNLMDFQIFFFPKTLQFYSCKCVETIKNEIIVIIAGISIIRVCARPALTPSRHNIIE